MYFNLPNLISLFRVIISPVIFVLLISNDKNSIIIGAVLFFIGAFSDFLDGWLARKMNLTSSWGRFFDPLADKFLTLSVFIVLVYLKIASLWMVAVILLRDVFTTYMRIVGDKMKAPIKTSKTAKFKTLVQMFYLSLILLIMIYDAQNNSNILLTLTKDNIPNIFLFFIVLLTVWSTVDYIIDNKDLFRKVEKETDIKN